MDMETQRYFLYDYLFCVLIINTAVVYIKTDNQKTFIKIWLFVLSKKYFKIKNARKLKTFVAPRRNFTFE